MAPSPPELGSLSTLPAPLPDAVVRYAPHDDGLVDVHLPEGGATAPLLVLLHGGFWRQAHDRRHTRATAAALAAAGFVVATPEYRRVGGAGGWPATGDDVEQAVIAAPDLLAGLGVRCSETVVAGHSAGGHLALWLATRPVAQRLSRVVALAPVAHLRAAARDRLGDGAVEDLLGGGPASVPERYDDADPATRLAHRPPCEVVVVHGDSDDVVPAGNSAELARAHPWLDLRVVAGADHFAVMDPTSAAWPVVVAATRGRPADLRGETLEA